MALVCLNPATAQAGVYPGPGVAGVSILCGPTSDYGCTTGGYNGSEPWGDYTVHGSIDAAGRRHNCTTYAAFRVASTGLPRPDWSADANGWDDYARSRGVQVNSSPAVG